MGLDQRSNSFCVAGAILESFIIDYMYPASDKANRKRTHGTTLSRKVSRKGSSWLTWLVALAVGQHHARLCTVEHNGAGEPTLSLAWKQIFELSFPVCWLFEYKFILAQAVLRPWLSFASTRWGGQRDPLREIDARNLESDCVMKPSQNYSKLRLFISH